MPYIKSPAGSVIHMSASVYTLNRLCDTNVKGCNSASVSYNPNSMRISLVLVKMPTIVSVKLSHWLIYSKAVDPRS